MTIVSAVSTHSASSVSSASSASSASSLTALSSPSIVSTLAHSPLPWAALQQQPLSNALIGPSSSLAMAPPVSPTASGSEKAGSATAAALPPAASSMPPLTSLSSSTASKNFVYGKPTTLAFPSHPSKPSLSKLAKLASPSFLSHSSFYPASLSQPERDSLFSHLDQNNQPQQHQHQQQQHHHQLPPSFGGASATTIATVASSMGLDEFNPSTFPYFSLHKDSLSAPPSTSDAAAAIRSASDLGMKLRFWFN